MKEQKWKWLWIAGIAVTVTAAAAAFMADRPKTPLIITYQESQTVLSGTEAETTESGRAHSTAEEKTKTTAAEQTGTQPAETEPDAETQTEIPDRNLNTADAAALRRVSGIGDVLAEAIISWRDAHGGFRRRAELLEIQGIGPALQERIMAEFEIPGELPPEEPAGQTAPAADEQTPGQLTADPVQTDPAVTEPAVYYYNINTVNKDELMQIPDMTERLADDILALRERLGGFQNLYELGLLDSLNGVYFEEVLRNYLYIE